MEEVRCVPGWADPLSPIIGSGSQDLEEAGVSPSPGGRPLQVAASVGGLGDQPVCLVPVG